MYYYWFIFWTSMNILFYFFIYRKYSNVSFVVKRSSALIYSMHEMGRSIRRKIKNLTEVSFSCIFILFQLPDTCLSRMVFLIVTVFTHQGWNYGEGSTIAEKKNSEKFECIEYFMCTKINSSIQPIRSRRISSWFINIG